MPDGCGYVLINHDFREKDALQYVYQEMPVAGATVTIKDSEASEEDPPIFTTSTDSYGRWNSGYLANVGSYVITFYKPGFYGPDVTTIDVTPEDLQNLPPQEQERYEQDTTVQTANYTAHFL
jgi:hypothetical protein